jgi:hypothetical protein
MVYVKYFLLLYDVGMYVRTLHHRGRHYSIECNEQIYILEQRLKRKVALLLYHVRIVSNPL